ncbi:hypothetical protein [Cohnella terricola]|uniref:Uncharacterized protein n=1 Tax=Cohnella terricola TaxID=1289167 RepID=A0A559J6J8_9BACL|nr:hypothetical protein [Cohnella terricola]TVX95504.1 hypothetical protein FPZ45_23565 [Cohnella terricola]
MGFEQEFERYLEDQKKAASGQRAEMLERNLAGTKLLFENLLLPVFGKFDGMEMEYEMNGLSGAKIYSDVGFPRIRTVFEEDHFVTHAEKITRDRFNFERARARSVAVHGFIYFPYSRDELEKKPDFCQRNLYELIGRIGSLAGTGFMQLPVYEREVLRCALMHYKPFQLSDVSEWLTLKKETCRKVIRELERKELVDAVGGGSVKCHEFLITDKAVHRLMRMV